MPIENVDSAARNVLVARVADLAAKLRRAYFVILTLVLRNSLVRLATSSCWAWLS